MHTTVTGSHEVGVAHCGRFQPAVRPELLTRDACYIRLADGREREGPMWKRGWERGGMRISRVTLATGTRLAPMKNSRRR